MRNQRKHYAPEEKVLSSGGILLEKEPIPKLYRWQKEFFENSFE